MCTHPIYILYLPVSRILSPKSWMHVHIMHIMFRLNNHVNILEDIHADSPPASSRFTLICHTSSSRQVLLIYLSICERRTTVCLENIQKVQLKEPGIYVNTSISLLLSAAIYESIITPDQLKPKHLSYQQQKIFFFIASVSGKFML